MGEILYEGEGRFLWMDMANSGCGYNSGEYHTDTTIWSDTTCNYTFYMQPTVYTLQPGHKLSLVLTTCDAFTLLTENPALRPDEGVCTDYGYTVDNRTPGEKLPLKNERLGEPGKIRFRTKETTDHRGIGFRHVLSRCFPDAFIC